MLGKKQVKVKVLQGNIIIGQERYVKGRTFVCDEDFALSLLSYQPGCYEIRPDEEPKPKKAQTSENKEAVNG